MQPSLDRLEGRTLLASAILLTPIPIVTNVGEANDLFDPANFTAPTAGTYQATIDWGDGTSSAAQITPSPVPLGDPTQSIYFVTGTHPYTTATAGPVTVLVTDSQGDSATQSVPLTVYSAPLAGSGIAQTVLPGFNIQSIADGVPVLLPIVNFQDASDPVPSKVVATIDWGDGSTPTTGTADVVATRNADYFSFFPASAANQPPQGGYEVTGNHLYSSQGVYTVTVTISDPDGMSTSIKSTIGVVPLIIQSAPVLVTTGGFSTTSDVSIADFSGVNSDLSTYAVAIDWGDGSAPSGGTVTPETFVGMIAVHPPGDSFTIGGSHTYAKPGNYTAKVTVLDTVSGYSAVTPTAIDVAKPPITAAATPFTILSGFPDLVVNQSDNELQPISLSNIATFQDRVATPTADIAVGIDWGDGTSGSGSVELGALPAGSTAAEAGYINLGNHEYQAPGTYTLTLFVLDTMTGSLATTTATATASPIVISEIPYPFSPLGSGSVVQPNQFSTGQTVGAVGVLNSSTLDPSSDYAIAINWGDGSAPTGGTLSNPPSNFGGFTTPSTFEVSGDHVYTQPGTYTLTITALDKATGQSTVGQTTIQVFQATITASAGASYSATAGQDLTIFASLGDSDTEENRTATVNWGDGTPPTSATITLQFVTELLEPDISLSADHVYASPGTYTIQVAVTGADGGSTTITDTAVIAPVPPPAPLTSTPLALPTIKHGVATSLKLGTITALDTTLKANELTAYVNYGDGSKTVLAKVVKTAAGTFQVDGQHAYKKAGTYVIQVSTYEKDGTSTSFEDSIIVS